MGKSLARRLILLSVSWIVVTLLATGYLLNFLYRQHIEELYDAHVFTHLEELIAAADTDENDNFRLWRVPTDPRFYRPDSGWYWAVLSERETLAMSDSARDGQMDFGGLVPDASHGVQIISGANGEELRGQVVHVSYPHDPGALTFVATAPAFQIAADVRDYTRHIMLRLLVLGAVLAAAAALLVRAALRPLHNVEKKIQAVKSGAIKRLSQDFPVEVQPLIGEINFLLDYNENLLEHARNQLGDLAHAVKNPLTVIRNEARSMEGGQGQLILDQAHIMSANIEHALSRARIYGHKSAVGFRTSVRSVMEDVAYAAGHIYKARDIEIHLRDIEDKWFQGEAQDLEEMAGNLLDNACKWARREVRVSVADAGGRLQLVFEDDGPGIDPRHYDEVQRRGRKLDDSRPGHGQGLGIVRDMAQLYGGALELGSSEPLGGLKAVLNLPSALPGPAGEQGSSR